MVASFDFQRLKLGRVLRAVFRRMGVNIRQKLPRGKAWASEIDVAVICPAYPTDSRPYGGQFVQSRVKAYKKRGLSVVVVVARSDTYLDRVSQIQEIPVWETSPSQLGRYLKKELCRRIIIHHPEKAVWAIVAPYAKTLKPMTIFHGYEVRPWTFLESSYSKTELVELRGELTDRDNIRKRTISEIFNNKDVTPVFVSKFLKQTAEDFSGHAAPANTQIIHNPVLSSEFPYRQKQAEDRYKILWLRSFQSYNYANDLARDTILKLSERLDFEKFDITIVGDGVLWDSCTSALKDFRNVKLRRGYVDRLEVPNFHAEHGIMLVPSRWESQGLTLCEAMSSGLVPITNAVAAVPEFVSSSEGFLCNLNDSTDMSRAIGILADSPDLFIDMSEKASERARRQLSLEKTVDEEVRLLIK